MSIADIAFMHKMSEDEVMQLWNTGMMMEDGEPIEKDAKVKANLMADPYHYGRYISSVTGGENVEEMALDPDEAFMHLAKFETGGKVGDLHHNADGIEIKAYTTTPEHAKEYGIEAKNPLYVQKIYVEESQRNAGKGKQALRKIEEFAMENGNDVVFGYITENATFSSAPDRVGYFEDMTVIKKWLRDKGYTVSVGNNDFHKVVNFEEGGKVGLDVTAKNLSDLLKGAIDNNSKQVEVIFKPAYDESKHSNFSENLKESLKENKIELFHVIHEADDILSLVGSEYVKSIKYIPQVTNENVSQEVKDAFQDINDDTIYSWVRLKDVMWRRDNITGEISNQGPATNFELSKTDLKSETETLSDLLEATNLALEFDSNPELEELKESTEIALSLL